MVLASGQPCNRAFTQIGTKRNGAAFAVHDGALTDNLAGATGGRCRFVAGGGPSGAPATARATTQARLLGHGAKRPFIQQ